MIFHISSLLFSHEDQEFPFINYQVQDCIITSSSSPKILSAPKLGFWPNQDHNWLFHLRMILHFKTWFKGLKYIFEVHSYDQNCPKGLIQWRLEIRVSLINFHLIHEGKMRIFCQYQVSWAIIQGNMVYSCIWSRFNQEIKVTCKRGKDEEIENLTKYPKNHVQISNFPRP